MALDVWVGYPEPHRGGPSVSFEPEAYYSFLYPLLEDFAARHGKMIDPYDGAVFEGRELEDVLALVDRARSLIERQAEAFDVHIGTNMGSFVEPRHEEIYFRVNRADYLVFIERLRGAVLEAKASSRPLVFFGD